MHRVMELTTILREPRLCLVCALVVMIPHGENHFVLNGVFCTWFKLVSVCFRASSVLFCSLHTKSAKWSQDEVVDDR